MMPRTADRQQMLAGVPATTRTFQVGGVATAVIEAGDGPPLLLLDGGIECGGAMWAPVLSRLAAHHRVVAPEIPGLGESAPLARLDVDTFGVWLAALVVQLGLEQPTVPAPATPSASTASRCSTSTPFADAIPAGMPRRRRCSSSWGRDDRMVPLAVAEAAARRHGWPLRIIDHAAHAPHVEQPDAFVDTLAGILAVR